MTKTSIQEETINPYLQDIVQFIVPLIAVLSAIMILSSETLHIGARFILFGIMFFALVSKALLWFHFHSGEERYSQKQAVTVYHQDLFQGLILIGLGGFAFLGFFPQPPSSEAYKWILIVNSIGSLGLVLIALLAKLNCLKDVFEKTPLYLKIETTINSIIAIGFSIGIMAIIPYPQS